MNRLVIIGNGFDIAHGMKTSYKDFVNWYCNQRVDEFADNNTRVSEDCLCKLIIKEKKYPICWYDYSHKNSNFKDENGNRLISGYDLIQRIMNNSNVFSFECSQLFSSLLQSIETRGWVDIENDYYQLLKNCVENPQCGYSVKDLNVQLAFLQNKLVDYLSTIAIEKEREDLMKFVLDYFSPMDFSTESRQTVLDYENFDFSAIKDISLFTHDHLLRNKLCPKRIMLLSFNYTGTVRRFGNDKTTINYIHGELDKPNSIIFGYGDELDKKYQDILDKNDNEFLKNVKSVKYLETRHYREMLEFIQSAPFQVFIMGHSCGNSDRTLLNTVFEHDNCVSIKPFYHKWDDGSDNFLDIVQNISRNFTNMKLFRDRVVNKEQCQTM